MLGETWFRNMEDMSRQSKKVSHIKFTDGNSTITDVSKEGDIPEGEDLSGCLRNILLLYLSLVLGLVSMHTVYPFPLLQFSAPNCWALLWTGNMWSQTIKG